MDMEKLADEICKNARDKGFHDAYTFATSRGDKQELALLRLGRIMLVVSELGEWADAVRKPGQCEKPVNVEEAPGHFRRITNEEEEWADAIIRLLDEGRLRGYDFRAIRAKHEYNTGRPAMHGGKLA